jgi:hypothetical protein
MAFLLNSNKMLIKLAENVFAEPNHLFMSQTPFILEENTSHVS